MLIQRFINTLPNRKDEEFAFDECSQLKTTIEKRTEEKVKKRFQNNVLVPKTNVRKKRAPP